MSKRHEFVEGAKPEPLPEALRAVAAEPVRQRATLEDELRDAQARIGRLMNRVGGGKRIPPGDVKDLMHILMRAYGDAVVVDTLGRDRG